MAIFSPIIIQPNQNQNNLVIEAYHHHQKAYFGGTKQQQTWKKKTLSKNQFVIDIIFFSFASTLIPESDQKNETKRDVCVLYSYFSLFFLFPLL